MSDGARILLCCPITWVIRLPHSSYLERSFHLWIRCSLCHCLNHTILCFDRKRNKKEQVRLVNMPLYQNQTSELQRFLQKKEKTHKCRNAGDIIYETGFRSLWQMALFMSYISTRGKSLFKKCRVTQLLDNVQMWTSSVPSTGVKLKPSKNYLHRVPAGPVGKSIKGRISLSCSFLICLFYVPPEAPL